VPSFDFWAGAVPWRVAPPPAALLLLFQGQVPTDRAAIFACHSFCQHLSQSSSYLHSARRRPVYIYRNTEKNGFLTATKLGTTNKIFVAATKNFAAATKRFVERTKNFVVVTK